MLTETEDICRRGYSPVSGKEIAIFYSDMALYNDIYLVESSSVNLGIFYAQGFNPIIHKEQQTFDVLRRWVGGDMDTLFESYLWHR
ncbi:MAG: hypothetical protein LIP01_11825 [Tannerellaceae bacterium]|nr:hypothetical protein [Tannerellaceae bacterium]